MGLKLSLKHDLIEIITGCMFSGKTEELIKRINSASSQGFKTILFKPKIDKRYHPEYIVSHNGTAIESKVISHSKEILNHITNIEIVGIDEAQFFDNDIVDVCHYLVSKNLRVILTGLNNDFNNHPFGPMPGLMAISNAITLLHSTCTQCGDKAFYTFKKSNSETLIEIGENDIYEPRCESCYKKGMFGK
jgi:thymidine kinase